MIDKIYILNAADQTERLGHCYRMLKNRKIPDEKIAVWTAKTCQPYKKTRDLCEAAAAEGYKFFEKLLQTKEYNTCNITNLAQTWSHCAFLQHITVSGETAILLYDDQKINCTLSDLENALDVLPDKNKLDIASLSCDLCYSCQLIEDTCWIESGRACLDSALLYTPKGAENIRTYLDTYTDNLYSGEYFWIIKDNIEYFDHFYGLLINPSPENMKNLRSLHDNLKNYTSFDLAAVENDVPIVLSTIHDHNPKGDLYLRPIEHTRDS